MTELAIPIPATTTLGTWHSWRQTFRAILLLGAREIKLAIRTPAYLIPNLIVPIFFYFVTLGSLKTFAGNYGLSNFEGFLLPMSVIFAVQGGSAGLNMVADIESGYFDKLLLTPVSRFAILIGAMSADFVRIFLQAALVLVVALAAGLHFETGVAGVVPFLLIGSLFGLAYSGIGFAIALKTGNAQATQSMWFLFMPLMFLTTMFAPKEALTGWLEVAATLNPMTYLLDGLRALSMEGWDGEAIGVALLAVAALGSFSLTMAFMALCGRVR
jgi:ABC-2 type transport system permease protein